MRRKVQFLFLGALFLLLLFLATGMLNPEISCQNTILTGTSTDKAFVLFTDTSVMKQWIKGLVRVEFLEGAMDAPGSTWKLLLKRGSREVELTETMTVYEPGRRLACSIALDMGEGGYDMRFTPSPQGTILTAVLVLRGRNWWWRSLFYLGSSRLERQSQEMHETLQMILEQKQVPA